MITDSVYCDNSKNKQKMKKCYSNYVNINDIAKMSPKMSLICHQKMSPKIVNKLRMR
jgi:hypothetical protein